MAWGAGCTRTDAPPEDDAAGDKANQGFAFDERTREEKRTRSHVSMRVKRAELPIIVKVSEAPQSVARAVTRGVCEVIEKRWKIRCSGPKTSKIRLWTSELDITLREVAGSVVVDLIGELLLNEGWETADLRLRYGVSGGAAKAGAESLELGRALAREWVREYESYLKKLAQERPPNPQVRWVAAPGFFRNDTFPLSYGFAEIVAGRVWTFQRSETSGQRVGYLIDEDGQVIRSESFETAPSEAKLRGWTTAAQPQQRAITMALPMTAADKASLAKAGDTQERLVVLALTRNGEARMVGQAAGFPLSAAMIMHSGDVAVLAARDNKLDLVTMNGIDQRSNAVHIGTAVPSPYQLMVTADDALVAVPTTPNREILLIEPGPATESSRRPPTKQNIASTFTTRTIYRLKSPPTMDRRASRRPKAALTARKRVVVVDGQNLIGLGFDGTQHFATPLGPGARELMATPHAVAVASDSELRLFDPQTGEPVAHYPAPVYAFIAAGKDRHDGYLACTSPGVVHLDDSLARRAALRLDDRCENLERLEDGELIAARLLWAARLEAPSRWPPHSP